jgi:hypothetical protein
MGFRNIRHEGLHNERKGKVVPVLNYAPHHKDYLMNVHIKKKAYCILQPSFTLALTQTDCRLLLEQEKYVFVLD